VEQVLGLDVEAPARDVWLAEDALDPRGHPVEAAGVRTDHRLRPLAVDGTPAYPNVVIAGSLLAGQRPLHERCRDGVGIASGWRAATVLAGAGAAPGAGSGSGARGDAS
jgi:glycerol-3-phosphate dehydrogenase subunit B